MSLLQTRPRPVRVEPPPDLAPDEPRAGRDAEPDAVAVRSAVLVCTPMACLLLAMLLGILVALKTVLPAEALAAVPMQILQPLHTLMSLGCVFAGICALFVFAAEDLNARGLRTARPIIELLLPAFIVLAAASILAGYGSGKEYLTWAPALTPLLLLLFGVMSAVFCANLRTFARRSPEAAWLIGLGLACMTFGLIEGSLHHAARLTFARELSFDWHALDILFAGWNAALYGFGILIASGSAKRLRARWLYALAAFTFVSTFGHHHYMSPQPHTIKIIAFVASMLAGLSFVRHVRAARRMGGKKPTGPTAPFLAAAEWWTLAAIGTGVLLAVPHVNLVLHGTYAIVAHSMGAMIGINVLLVLGGLAFYLRPDAARSRRIALLVALACGALVLMYLNLSLVGLVKGFMRFDRPQTDFQPILRVELYPLPVLGAVLAVALALICRELFSRLLASRRLRAA